MKKPISNIIILGLIILSLIFLYNTYKRQMSVDFLIEKNGRITKALITKGIVSKLSVREFIYKYHYKGKQYVQRGFVEKDFFNLHEINDTIIVKFLPLSPGKSVIMDNKEYKSCMGLSPEDGWKDLPQCKDTPQQKINNAH